MIAEFIMSRCGWDAVWYLEACGDTPAPGEHWWHFARLGACIVGTWTGPDGDLLCVRSCDSVAEAKANLSPPGRFILDATLRSLWRRWARSASTAKDLNTRIHSWPGCGRGANRDS